MGGERGEAGLSDPQFLFTVSGKRFVIPLLKVKEVARVAPITFVPGLPKHFRGVMNLRGRIVSVLDLRVWFSLPISDSPEAAVMVLDAGSQLTCALVDSVDSVVTDPVLPNGETARSLDIEKLLEGSAP